MRRSTAAVVSAVAVVVLWLGAAARAADEYPRTIVAQAQAASGVTKITSVVTIKIERLVTPATRTRLLDGLKYNGYQGFMNVLRPLPVVGTIATQSREVEVRYAWETKAENRTRLVVVADKPLFFLSGDATKSKAGYELTVVDLQLDERGAGTGTLAGAARVKPAPDGIVLDDFAASPVQLTIAAPTK